MKIILMTLILMIGAGAAVATVAGPDSAVWFAPLSDSVTHDGPGAPGPHMTPAGRER